MLLAVDGSEGAARAVRHLLALRQDLREPGRHASAPAQRAAPGLGRRLVLRRQPARCEEYHHERSEAALAPARALLDADGVAYEAHQRVGSPGPTIAEVARELGCDLIVMGTRGLGSHTAALLGSVAQRHDRALPRVPVLLVK